MKKLTTIAILILLGLSSLYAGDGDGTTYNCIDTRDGEKFTYSTIHRNLSKKIVYSEYPTKVIQDNNGTQRYLTKFSEIYIKCRSSDGTIVR